MEDSDMTVGTLLQALEKAGAKVQLDGAYLVLSAPRPLGPDLVDRVRAQKASLMEQLQPRKTDWNQMPERQDGTPFNQEALDAIHIGKAVRVWSQVLEEWLWWVRDEESREHLLAEGCQVPIYTLGELAVVAGMDAKALSDLHGAKHTFGGSIAPAEGDPAPSRHGQ